MGFFRKANNCVPPLNVSELHYKGDMPYLCDGVDVLDMLCPVSKVTGLRENPLSLIRKLVTDPAKQALLYQFLQEVPTDSSQSQLSDEERFDLCIQRLDCGTPAENDAMREVLMNVFDHASSALKPVVDKVSDKIDFNGTETQTD